MRKSLLATYCFTYNVSIRLRMCVSACVCSCLYVGVLRWVYVCVMYVCMNDMSMSVRMNAHMQSFLLVFLQVYLRTYLANAVCRVLQQNVPVYCPAVCDLSWRFSLRVSNAKADRRLVRSSLMKIFVFVFLNDLMLLRWLYIVFFVARDWIWWLLSLAC